MPTFGPKIATCLKAFFFQFQSIKFYWKPYLNAKTCIYWWLSQHVHLGNCVFWSTSLPLSSTRWVQLTLSSMFKTMPSINLSNFKISSEQILGMVGFEPRAIGRKQVCFPLRYAVPSPLSLSLKETYSFVWSFKLNWLQRSIDCMKHSYK